MRRVVVEVDQDGNLVIPPQIKEQFRISPGSKILLEVDEDRLHLSRPSDGLNRVYIEVTNRCNLDCSTCIRNVWDDQLGSMPLAGFQKILADLKALNPAPEIFFGGYGEPLSHPDILPMIAAASQSGAKTSLITNGTLLSHKMSEALVAEAGLDMLWVSIDGARPESYQDIRLGDHLPRIIENLETFKSIRDEKFGHSPWSGKPGLGIAFVLMKKNAAELAEVIRLGKQVGAKHFFVTNLLAYTDEMAAEVLYDECLYHSGGSWEGSHPRIWLPRMDFEAPLRDDIWDLLMQGHPIRIGGNVLNRNPFLCPFVARGATVVRWDGEASPCLPLLYEHTSVYETWKRTSRPRSFGNAFKSSLPAIWLSSEYEDFRQQLLYMNFSPCVDCHTCALSEDNSLDCTGYGHPNCGGCLWAHGVIQCP